MGKKLGKGIYPENSGPNDFQCSGPPAINDGQFDGCKIADLGAFSQDNKDTNKYYHAAIVKHRISGGLYLYLEWGRTGASNPQFQFIKCDSEQEAQQLFNSQCHSKNDKRGEWVTIAGIKTLQAKPGKDVYLVRALATRSTGLPDAKTIKYSEGLAKATIVKSNSSIDDNTAKLLKDLMGGTVSYTRGSMADASIPTAKAIEHGHNILTEAKKRLIVVGSKIEDQVNDKELRELTFELYRRIPKKKALGAEWILNQDNILEWVNNLDAFASVENVEENSVDPYYGLPITMELVNPNSGLGKFLYKWWPESSANRHGYLNKMRIKNIWRVERKGDLDKVLHTQERILGEVKGKVESPLFQPSERLDILDSKQKKLFQDSNTALLFHGTRSVNVAGILSTSFRLPKQLVGVHITGAMFGGGIYFADDWKKSAGYTSLGNSVWSGGGGAIKGREAFMFACDVVLGQPYIAPGPRGFTGPPNGTHSIFGMGRIHGQYVSKYRNNSSGVENNEWVIFQSQQTQLRYLAEFTA